MPDILNVIARYGYESLFAAMFLEAIGFPIPAALALLAAGAASASGVLHPVAAIAVAVVAMLTGDIILYVAGRRMGWQLLGFLCGLSLSPEVCILRSAKWFYKRGRTTLLFAKFLPGVNTMAPPLAEACTCAPGSSFDSTWGACCFTRSPTEAWATCFATFSASSRAVCKPSVVPWHG